MVRKKEIEDGYARGYCKLSVQIFRISVFETDSTATFWRTGDDVKNGFGLWGHSFCLFKVFLIKCGYMVLVSILSCLLNFYQIEMCFFS